MRKILFAGLALLGFASTASAQFSNFPRTAEPAYWMSGGVGAFNGQGVQDGSTHSTWNFGQKTSWQYRASLEKAIQNQSSIGIVGTFVHVPFTYSTPRVIVLCIGCTQSPTPCGTVGGDVPIDQCPAHLDMMSLAVQFHAGGGTGFHQVLEVALGATAYRNLKRDSDGAALPPTRGNVDGSFSLAYGFGYGLSPGTEITLVQDYGLVLHESTGLQSGTSNTNRVRSIRMALRYGFGTRLPGQRRR